MKYIIIKQTKNEVKLWKNIYLKDLIVILGLFFLGYIISPFIHSYLQIPFHIFIVIVGVVSCMPSPTNPKKRIYNSIFYALKKKNTYKHFGG
ncbi:MAG: hypothetical protein KFW09_05325 [Oscillospiraceae bacterium]|nr:hypothetical protein [Oscillospiraceae bacterium]